MGGFGPMASVPLCSLPWWLWGGGGPVPTPWFVAEQRFYTAGLAEGHVFEAGQGEGGIYNAGMVEGHEQ